MEILGVKQTLKEQIINPIRVYNKRKIFCIGRNKTGTTSLAAEFRKHGFIVGNQRRAEKMVDHYVEKDFDPIIRYCRSAQVFQDAPFSWPETYKYLDAAYPDSLFILTVRDSPEQWYRSITRFHAKLFGKGEIPTAKDLKKAKYIRPGWMWKVNRAHYKTPEDDPYNKEILLQQYLKHNREVKNHFGDCDNFMVLNLKKENAYSRFCRFIGVKKTRDNFPWKNKTTEVKVRN